VADDLLRNWAATSNDNDMRSLSLQQMVADQFGVPLSEWQAGKLETMGVAREVGYAGYVATPNAQGVIDIASPAFAKTFPEWQAERRGIGAEEADKAGRDMLQRMYDRTQEQFAAAGVTEVVVYRGVSSDAIPNDIWSTVQLPSSTAVSVRLTDANAAESWSLSPHVAQEFVDRVGGNGAVIQVIVPVTAILSTFTSGWGCAEEAEVVVLNHGTMDARVAHDDGGLLGVPDPNDEVIAEDPYATQAAIELKARAPKPIIMLNDPAHPERDNADWIKKLDDGTEVLLSTDDGRKAFGFKYSDDQERDELGRFSAGGGGSSEGGNLKVVGRGEPSTKKERALVEKLGSVGGVTVVWLGDEPDAAKIESRGVRTDGKGAKLVEGEPNACHSNTVTLYLAGKVDQIVTGYALNNSDNMWRQHTWGLKGDRVVETTVPRDVYFGFTLTGPEAADFVQENRP
jgi:hypothetical protein